MISLFLPIKFIPTVIKRNKTSYSIADKRYFKKVLLQWANLKYKDVFNFDSNNANLDAFKRFDCVIACGSLQKVVENNNCIQALKDYERKNNDWLFATFTYDLKNEFEALESDNLDGIEYPVMQLNTPALVFTISDNTLEIHHFEDDISTIWNEIIDTEINLASRPNSTFLEQRTSKEKYIETVKAIQQQITEGVVYEMNYCIEFYKENITINPYQVFIDLNEKANAPFSAFIKNNGNYLLSASPERYIQKTGSKLISQPIKGTAKRGNTLKNDQQAVIDLENNLKERAENIMIVDLVRNDFHRLCETGTVNVDELCKIYSFDTVHQMISTISGTLPINTTLSYCLEKTFPMGSMTGAPKISAMQLIEQFEDTKRGIYSGAVGYIQPNGDFDFNVIIRSIVYNSDKKYLSLQIGSAITIDSVPEKEYDECLLKAKALIEVLQNR